jgi:hypothetical protein
MFKRTSFIGMVVLASATAFGGQPNKGGDFYTVTVQGGQGSPFSISVPVPSQDTSAPYALTGQDAGHRELHWVTRQFGQGSQILVAE